jgi:D-glycero-D-manno-heptose 1,7-bisphosphate phosphatase
VTRAVVLDRDGTLIDVVRDEETGAITTAFHPSQIVLLSGVVEGLRVLRDAGFVLAIASNQPGPAKKHFSADAVARTNAALVALLAEEGITIANVQVCMHHPTVSACDCRKPKPGMLTTIARELGIAPAASWMVGDSDADVQAGAAAGMRTGLVFPMNRCELCPLRAGVASVYSAASASGARALPTVHGATLHDVATLIARS